MSVSIDAENGVKLGAEMVRSESEHEWAEQKRREVGMGGGSRYRAGISMNII